MVSVIAPTVFQQPLSCLFRIRYRVVTVNCLWIKRRDVNLFAILVVRMRRLVIRPGAIGDFIVSLPALECLRTDYFEVWTASRTAPLVQFADQVRPIASTGLDLVGITDAPA